MTASARLMLTYYWVALLFSHFVGSFQLHRTTSGQYGIITRLKVASADSEMNWDPKSGPKLDFNEDYYSVLDVESTVEAKELKKAYYKLVFKYHPDNIENESSKSLCNKQMMVINGAYRILKNINLRIMYDRQRRKGLVGAGAGIKESSVNNDGSKPITPPKSAQASEQQKAPPKTAAADPSAASKGYGKKYGSGFGGSWGSSDDKENDDFEQEYNEQERERERQRQRYQEPQPQTQRERDQQTRDRNQEFDFTYDQSGQYETPKRTPWGFNTNTYDEPVRPSEPYRESAYQRNGAEEYLRSAGRGVDDIIDSNLRGLKVQLENLCIRKINKEREIARMVASVKDWGEVTDVRLIRQRIEDINDLKSMTQEIDELADEIAHIMQQNKKENDRAYGYSSRTTRPQPTPTPTYKPPVDLWGESPRSSSPPRTATRPPPPPPRAAPPRSATPTPTTAPTRTARKEPDTRDVGRNNVKGMDDYLDYNFDEETLDNFGGEEEDDEKESTKSPWRKQYESRRNPNGSGQAFASFLFEDEEPQVVDEEEEEEEDGQNRAVLNELLRLFKMSKKPKK